MAVRVYVGGLTPEITERDLEDQVRAVDLPRSAAARLALEAGGPSCCAAV